AGVSCSKPAAYVILTFTHSTRTVRVVTDGLGRYRVSLPAGTWIVRASAGMRIAPATFVVPRRRTMTRNFSIDTGIR
ncbi:MAG TPA: hypothetical protein VMU73_05905, partial [Gaiellaceae bacterium]|nr:hypothetical protein [Gaiellaceae bacterium]